MKMRTVFPWFSTDLDAVLDKDKEWHERIGPLITLLMSGGFTITCDILLLPWRLYRTRRAGRQHRAS